MKKTIVAALVAVCSLGVAQAQDAVQNIRFGAKAGLNISNFSITDPTNEDIDDSSRTGFHIGAVAEIPVSQKFAIQPELVYSTQGNSMKITDEGLAGELKIKSDYLNIPVLAKFYAAKGLSLLAGPQLGILVNNKNEVEVMGMSITVPDSDEIKTKGIDFSLALGAGYRLDNGISFDARYNLGLNDVLDNNEAAEEGVEFRNRVFQISVGYFF